MNCPKCSAVIDDDSIFCDGCGYKVAEAHSKEALAKFDEKELLAKNEVNKISLTIYGIIVLMFIFPFINISCSGQKVATFTGIQLVAGTTVQNRKVGGEPLAMIVILMAMIGFAGSFMNNKSTHRGLAIASAVGMISILLLRTKLTNTAVGQGMNIEYTPEFWFVFILFGLAIAENLFYPSVAGWFQGNAPNQNISKKASGTNNISDLEKLADLKTKGIISEEEFAAKKKRILGL